MVRTSLPSVSLLWPPKLLYSSPHFPAGDQVQTTPHSSRVHSLDTWFLFTPHSFLSQPHPNLTRPGLYLTATIPTPTLQLQSFPLDSGRTWTAVPVRPLGHHFHSLLWFSSHLSLKDRPQMSSSGNLVLLPPSELAQPPRTTTATQSHSAHLSQHRAVIRARPYCVPHKPQNCSRDHDPITCVPSASMGRYLVRVW